MWLFTSCTPVQCAVFNVEQQCCSRFTSNTWLAQNMYGLVKPFVQCKHRSQCMPQLYSLMDRAALSQSMGSMFACMHEGIRSQFHLWHKCFDAALLWHISVTISPALVQLGIGLIMRMIAAGLIYCYKHALQQMLMCCCSCINLLQYSYYSCCGLDCQ